MTPHFKKLRTSRSFFEKADIGEIFKNGFFFFQPLEDINRLLVPYLQKGVEKNNGLFELCREKGIVFIKYYLKNNFTLILIGKNDS